MHMASLACLRPSLLRFPPELRSSTLRNICSRPFSATTARSISLADVAVTGPNAVLDAIHSTGLSWAFAIPATAILVRGVLVYRFATLPTRKRQRVHSILLPLTYAKSRMEAQHREQLVLKKSNEISEWQKKLSLKIISSWIPMRTLHRLGKKFGAPLFTTTGTVNFVVLIAFTEAIRLKCSSRHGLLSAILYPFQWLAHKIAPNTFRAPEGWAAPDAPLEQQQSIQLEEISSAAREGTSGQGAEIQANTQFDNFQISVPDGRALAEAGQLRPNVGPSTEQFNPYLDSSMSTEGFAWIQDLTLPDTTLALPIAVSAALIIPTLLEARSNPAPVGGMVQPERPGLRLTNGQRIRISIGFIFTFVCANIPSAVLLYFFSSMAVATLQRMWLDFKYPFYKPIVPCTRPVRVKVTRKWDEI